MKKTLITISIPEKTLLMKGKLMNLENTFKDAEIDSTDPEDPVLQLKYQGNFNRKISPIEAERDKLEETYGERIFEDLTIGGNMCGRTHYVSIYGNIKPIINR